MKNIRVPNDIEIKNFATGQAEATVSFPLFVRMTLLSDTKFSTNYKALTTAQRIDKALDAVSEGVCALQTADWDMLKGIAEAPSAGNYHGLAPMAMVQLIPFIDAIVGASDA